MHRGIVAPLAQHFERPAEVGLGPRPVERIGATGDKRKRGLAIEADRLVEGLRLLEEVAAAFQHVGLFQRIGPPVVGVVGGQFAGRLGVGAGRAQVIELERLDLGIGRRDLGLLALGVLEGRSGGEARLLQGLLGPVQVAGLDRAARLSQQARGGRIVLLRLERESLVHGRQFVRFSGDKRDHLIEIEPAPMRQLHTHSLADRRQRPLRDMLLGHRALHLHLNRGPLRQCHPGGAHFVRQGLGARHRRQGEPTVHHHQGQKRTPPGAHAPPPKLPRQSAVASNPFSPSAYHNG